MTWSRQKTVSLAFWATNFTLAEYYRTVAPFHNILLNFSQAGLSFGNVSYAFPDFATAYKYIMQPSGGAMVRYGYYGSRLIPRSVHVNNSTALAEALWDANVISISSVGGKGVASFNPNSVAANPAWRQAIWHAITSVVWNESTSYRDQLTLRANMTSRLDYLRRIAPNSGCYFNEMDMDEPHWQDASFGSHYPRLLSIKKVFDPTSLFLCHHCVGSEGWDLDSNCRESLV